MSFKLIGTAPVGRGFRLIGGWTPTPTPSVTLSDIQALFGAGDDGGIYTFDDLTKLYTDISYGTTTPVVANNDPVGTILDLSGKGRHLSAATTGARLFYRTNGGLPCVLNDGNGKLITAALTNYTAETRIVAFRQLAAGVDPAGTGVGYRGTTEGDIIVDRAGNTNGYVYQSGAAGSGTLKTKYGTSQALGTVALGTDGVAAVTRNGANGTTQIDQGTPTSITGFTTAVSTGMMLGGGSSTTTANVYVFGLFFINRVLTPTDVTKVVSFLASKQGRSI